MLTLNVYGHVLLLTIPNCLKHTLYKVAIYDGKNRKF